MSNVFAVSLSELSTRYETECTSTTQGVRFVKEAQQHPFGHGQLSTPRPSPCCLLALTLAQLHLAWVRAESEPCAAASFRRACPLLLAQSPRKALWTQLGRSWHPPSVVRRLPAHEAVGRHRYEVMDRRLEMQTCRRRADAALLRAAAPATARGH